ncbi:hypothetical protein VKT23_004797 [Stygiomarasmius scandens]|uniref:Extracellular mutant protein 11 C-terminal domain-containing protein n=1 Tax=Marasmiellus scandens TaxID=2682957 RepID=A0ABR1JU45_9AGAR
MSTRAPFVPSGAARPPSRTAHSRDQFTPDRSNPLHKPTDPSSVHKPLNVNGLIKKAPANSNGNPNGLSRKPSGTPHRTTGNPSGKPSNVPTADQPIIPNALIRPRNPNTNANVTTPNGNASPIIAPTPINAAARTASPLFRSNNPRIAPSNSNTSPNLAFKTPAPRQAAENAHTPASDTHSGSNPNNDPFKLNFSNGTGPQRVPLPIIAAADESLSGSGDLPMSGLIRASNKRSRADFEADQDDHVRDEDVVMIDDDMMYSGQGHDGPGPMKRYKAQVQGRKDRKGQVDEIEEVEYTRPSLSPVSPMRPDRDGLQPFSSPIDQLDNGRDRSRTRTRSIQGHSDMNYEGITSLVQDAYATGGDASRQPGFTRPRAQSGLPLAPGRSNAMHTRSDGGYGDSQDEARSSLDKLLSCDTSAFVDEHMDKYERLANRWRECDMDEWIKGADEIMTKYCKILDFVKDHMSRKLKLFTTFDAQVDAHNEVLAERKEVLESAKRKLLEGGGSMIQG